MKALWTIAFGLMRLAFIAAIGCFCFYVYYQIEFCRQPSWISDEAFRLQSLYLTWLGDACGAVIVAWIFNGLCWWMIDRMRQHS